jgi:DNA polymerase III alpha subunit
VNRRYLLDTFDLLSKYKTTESKSKDRVGQSENKLLIELAKQGKHTDIVSLVESSLKLIKDGGCFFSQSRLDEVREELKFYKMNGDKRSYDNPLWVAFTEEHLFGAALTCKKIDAYDSSAANMTCKDFSCGKEQDFMVFAVDIDDVKEYTTASGPNEGKKNASIYISDGTGKIRARAWSDTYEEFLELLKPGNSVIIRGERGKKKFSDTLTIKQVMQAVANVI